MKCRDCQDEAFPGRCACMKHLIARRIRSLKWYRKEDRRLHWKERRKKRMEQGRCTRCGKPLDVDADENMTKCINCREGLCK
jgi:hypothetical protein